MRTINLSKTLLIHWQESINCSGSVMAVKAKPIMPATPLKQKMGAQ